MDLLGLIKQMEEERIKARKAPYHVLSIDLATRAKMTMEELSNELEKLSKDGKIEIGRTINYKHIKAI